MEESWITELENYLLDEKIPLTYRWVSRTFKIHVNTAKQVLFAFREKYPDEVETVYLLAGRRKRNDSNSSSSSSHIVSLVSEENLTEAEAKLETVTSKHIYSLVNVSLSKRRNLDWIQNVDMEKVMEDIYLNGFSAIKNRRCIPRVPCEKPEPKVEKSPPPPPHRPPSQQQQQPETSKKKKSGIADMFARAKKKEKVVEEEKSSPEKENRINEQLEKEAEEEKKKKRKRDDSDNEERKGGKSRSRSSKTKNNQKKRKRIKVISDSEGSSEEEEIIRTDSPPPPPQATLIESEDEDEIPPTPEPGVSKKKKRFRVKKMVNKTFVDEDGYMVTKKVQESCSESENEQPEHKPVVQKPVLSTSSKKSKNDSKPHTKQASIMNFFKKK